MVLLTEDAQNRQKAQKDGISAMSVRDYVRGMKNGTELLDLLAAEGPAMTEIMDAAGGRKALYPEARFLEYNKLYCSIEFLI